MSARQVPVQKPIFVVGMLRSGTTMVLEALAARDDLAWFSRPLNKLPWLPAVCVAERLASIHPALRSTMFRSDQIGPGLRRLRRLERLRLGPTEGAEVWRHWAGERFMSGFIAGAEATELERRRLWTVLSKVLRYEGKPRFIGKLSGPTRIGYLSSVFADARFVHVIRDPRAVVHSLAYNHREWQEGFTTAGAPTWEGLDEGQLDHWAKAGRSPVALAAIEWRAVIGAARREAAEVAADRYLELRYEDFIADPHRRLDEITAFCGLPRSEETHAFLDARVRIRDMNEQWPEALSRNEVATVEELTGELLGELGYAPSARS